MTLTKFIVFEVSDKIGANVFFLPNPVTYNVYVLHPWMPPTPS